MFRLYLSLSLSLSLCLHVFTFYTGVHIARRNLLSCFALPASVKQGDHTRKGSGQGIARDPSCLAGFGLLLSMSAYKATAFGNLAPATEIMSLADSLGGLLCFCLCFCRIPDGIPSRLKKCPKSERTGHNMSCGQNSLHKAYGSLARIRSCLCEVLTEL